MHNTLKAAVILAFIGIAVSVFAWPANARPDPTADREFGQASSARDLYIRNCARCHGSDGTGGTDLGRRLEVPNIRDDIKGTSNAKIVRVITNGKAEMPGFGKTMSKKQIASVAAYVRKL